MRMLDIDATPVLTGEMLLLQTLMQVLIKIGVLAANTIYTPDEILSAATDYLERKN